MPDYAGKVGTLAVVVLVGLRCMLPAPDVEPNLYSTDLHVSFLTSEISVSDRKAFSEPL